MPLSLGIIRPPSLTGDNQTLPEMINLSFIRAENYCGKYSQTFFFTGHVQVMLIDLHLNFIFRFKDWWIISYHKKYMCEKFDKRMKAFCNDQTGIHQAEDVGV